MEAKVTNVNELNGGGDMVTQLINNDFDPSCLRTNAALPHDAWLSIDSAIIRVAGQRLNGIADLQSYGLTRTLTGGLGAKYDFWQTVSDDLSAQQNMEGVTVGAKNRLAFGETMIPIPLTFCDFDIGIRELAASQKDGRPIDTTHIEVATRKVIEKLEDTLFNGSTVVAGGYDLPGYLTYSGSNEVALTGSWTSTPTNIEKDVVKLIARAEADRHYGPYVLYLHTDEWADMRIRDTVLGLPYLEILKSMAGVADVKPSDALGNGEIALVSMTSDVISLATAVDIVAVPWESHGGMLKHFRVMAAIAPRCMSDSAGRCGICFDNNLT